MKSVAYGRCRTGKAYFNGVDADYTRRVHEGLLASGWALTSDTNQCDWGAVTEAALTTAGTPPTNCWTAGRSLWNTYRLDDALHSTLPIYLNFGWMFCQTSYPQIVPWLYVGTLTDGAGRIVNSACGGWAEYPANTPSTTWEPLPLAFTCGDGYAGMSMINTGISSQTNKQNTNASFFVSRTTDGNGSPTGEGFFVYTNQAAGYKDCYFHDANTNNGFLVADVANKMRRFVFNFGAFATTRVSQLQTYRIQAITAAKTFVDENAVVCMGDMVWPSTFKATPVGVEHAFVPMCGAPASSTNHHAVDVYNTLLAFRWE